MSNYTELISSTAHASHLAYGFESARIDGYGNDKVVAEAQRLRNYTMPSNLEYLEDMYNSETGTSGTAFRNKDTGEVILAFTGTNFQSEFLKDVGTDINEINFPVLDHCIPAFEFYERVRAKYGNNIVLTGHSLGGSIAQRVALEYNVQKTVVYNSAPLYVNDARKIGLSYGELLTIDELEKKYTGETIRIRSEDDIVSKIGGKHLG